MTTSARTTATAEEFVRPRSALGVIKRYCDEMAEQERVADQYHTLLAVDLDVVHMAAFPLENLSLGSVFHAWAPLRALAHGVQRATRQADTLGRMQGIEEVFARDSARIPLLTTMALSEYIFRWRAPENGFKRYAVLPPHEFEWNRAREQGQDIAARWHDTLPNRVRQSDIQRIIGDETDAANIAGNLLDKMPETLSVLFPAQLRADHADRTLHEMELSGIVAKLNKVPGSLPSFNEVIASPEAKFIEEKIFESLFKDSTQSDVLKQLTPSQQARAIERIRKTAERDARALTWLQQINLNPGNQIAVELEGKTKKLRAILITASARVWRAARQFGLAASCLRNPVAYLGEGRFFEWAFKDLIGDENELFATLRRGELSRWLEPLVGSPGRRPAQDQHPGVNQTYLSCVHEWERLMSHLATSLNLSSPTSGLQRAIADARSGTNGRELVDKLASLLSKKIVDATLRLAKNANVTGLRDPSDHDVLWRNLPPVMLDGYAEADDILGALRTSDFADEEVRNQLIERIIGLETCVSPGQDAHVAKDYLETVLMSLLWMRMGQWGKARDVVKSAVGFALSVEDKAFTATVDIEHDDIRGDEALYLFAVISRLAAKSAEDLVEAHAALRLAEQLCADYKETPRFLAEEQSRGVAEMLFSPTSEPTTYALGALRLDLILKLFDSEPWRTLRAPWQDGADFGPSIQKSAGITYSDSYALQQMYCVVLMRYMLAFQPSQDATDDKGKVHRVSVDAIINEFERFAKVCKSWQPSWVADSTTTTQVRAAYLCWTDRSQRAGEAGNLLRTQFRQMLDQEDQTSASGLDRQRTEWMYRRLAKGWLV